MVPPRSIGRVHSWHGNALVLARALTYIAVHGGDGLRRVAERAVLNANWIRVRLGGCLDVPFDRVHAEIVLAAATLRKVRDPSSRRRQTALRGRVPLATVYFPLIVDEALMLEPTETESLQTLESLADALERIAREAAVDDGIRAGRRGRRRCGGWTRPVQPRTLIPTFDAQR